eukprot:evm.model.scf_59.16 EVM.evm.TU.scf_59.16   scf_59:120830-129241(-)
MSHKTRPARGADSGRRRDWEPGEVGRVAHRRAASPRSGWRSESPVHKRSEGVHQQHSEWQGQNRQYRDRHEHERRRWQHSKDRHGSKHRWGPEPLHVPADREPGEVACSSGQRAADDSIAHVALQAPPGDGDDKNQMYSAHEQAPGDHQNVVHQDSPDSCGPDQFRPSAISQSLTVRMANDGVAALGSTGGSLNRVPAPHSEVGNLVVNSGQLGDAERQARMQKLKHQRWGTQVDGPAQSAASAPDLGGDKVTTPRPLVTERPGVHQLQRWKEDGMKDGKAGREGSARLGASTSGSQDREQSGTHETPGAGGAPSREASAPVFGKDVKQQHSCEGKPEMVLQPPARSEPVPGHQQQDYPVKAPEVLPDSRPQSLPIHQETPTTSVGRSLPHMGSTTLHAPSASLRQAGKDKEKEPDKLMDGNVASSTVHSHRDWDHGGQNHRSDRRSLPSDGRRDWRFVRRSPPRSRGPQTFKDDVWVAGQPYKRPNRHSHDIRDDAPPWKSSGLSGTSSGQRFSGSTSLQGGGTVRGALPPHGSNAGWGGPHPQAGIPASGGHTAYADHVPPWKSVPGNAENHRERQSAEGGGRQDWQRGGEARMDGHRRWQSSGHADSRLSPRSHDMQRYQPLAGQYQHPPAQQMANYRSQHWSAPSYRPHGSGQQWHPPLPPGPPPDQVQARQPLPQQAAHRPPPPRTPPGQPPPGHPSGVAPPVPPVDPPPLPPPDPGADVPPPGVSPLPPPPPGSPPRDPHSDKHLDNAGVAVKRKEDDMKMDGNAASHQQQQGMRKRSRWEPPRTVPMPAVERAPSETSSHPSWQRYSHSRSAWSGHNYQRNWQGQHSQSPDWRTLKNNMPWNSYGGSVQGTRMSSSVPGTPPKPSHVGDEAWLKRMDFNQKLRDAMTKGFKRMSKVFGGQDIPGRFRARLACRMFHAACHECDSDYYCTSTDEEDECGRKRLRVTMGMRLRAKKYLEKMVDVKGKKNRNKLRRLDACHLPFVAVFDPNTHFQEEDYPMRIPSNQLNPNDVATDPRMPLPPTRKYVLQIPTLAIDRFALAIKEEKRKTSVATMKQPLLRPPPESGAFHFLTNKGGLSCTAYKLDALRSMVSGGPALGSSVWRADDDLWLPLRHEPYMAEELRTVWATINPEQGACVTDPEECCRIRVANVDDMECSGTFKPIRGGSVHETPDSVRVMLIVTGNSGRPIRVVVIPRQHALGLMAKKIGEGPAKDARWFADANQGLLKALESKAGAVKSDTGVGLNVRSQNKSRAGVHGGFRAVPGLQHRARFSGEVFKKVMGHKVGPRLRECARKAAVAAFAEAGVKVGESNLHTAGSFPVGGEKMPSRKAEGEAAAGSPVGKKRNFNIMSLVESVSAFASRKRRQ